MYSSMAKPACAVSPQFNLMASKKESKMTSYPLSFRESYTHNFTIPSQFKSLLTYYKMSKWSASYFISQWEKNIGTYAAGTIHKYNEINHVQFCYSCSLGKIKSMLSSNPDLQLVLSFRKAQGLPAYVLVDFIQADKSANLDLIFDIR